MFNFVDLAGSERHTYIFIILILKLIEWLTMISDLKKDAILIG